MKKHKETELLKIIELLYKKLKLCINIIIINIIISIEVKQWQTKNI